MDRITQALLDEFSAQNSLQNLSPDKRFEHFAGFLVTVGHHQEMLSTEEIIVGAGGDCGIDSIAIIVNGMLITEPEEIDDLASTNGFLDVTFVFVQAETSASFETAKIGQFIYGVQDFFSSTPQLPRNSKVQLYDRIWSEILGRSRLFKKGNPQIFLYYVTTGKWTDDANLVARKDAGRNDIEALGIFRRIVFECIDADKLQRLYRESQNAVSVEITFSDRTVIPDIRGVEQAYLGLLPATEFLKLIENENQEILNAIFYDNVRHWQDWNPVNSEIRDTLSNVDTRVFFPLLNNGVTVVARRINQTANRFLVEDYQVVNGCQTSFVLQACRDFLDERTMIPIRLIATQDDGIKNAIIKATNRQTLVTEEQLFALSDFPKKLEAYFPTFDPPFRLFFERRSRQYNGVEGIEKVRIFNMTMLIRAFASMFLLLPHRTTRNYKALLSQIGSDIFNIDHRLEPYYISAFTQYRIEYLFRNQTIGPELKPARYHLMMAVRLIVRPDQPPRMNSHDMVRYCQTIQDRLWDEPSLRDVISTAVKCVLDVAQGNLHRDNIRTEAFTTALIQHIIPGSR